jgi:hypothetical protein
MAQKKESGDKARKKIKLFISYSSRNRELAMGFLEKFRVQADCSEKHDYSLWNDNNILVGETWHDEIQRALEECDLGLLLVSPEFLGSEYIDRDELPTFVKSDSKPLIPIMLKSVVRGQNLKGLQRTQIFRLYGSKFNPKYKAYGDCTGNQRDRFAQELFLQVELRLDKF